MSEENEPLLPSPVSRKKDSNLGFIAFVTIATICTVSIGGAVLLEGKTKGPEVVPQRRLPLHRVQRFRDAWDPCQGDLSHFPFCNTDLSLDERLDNLVSLVDQSEIGPQLTARQSPAIPRLGLPAYYWGTNAIHGLQNTDCLPNGQCPTSFPAPVSLAATFNSTHTAAMGRVIGTELRAYFNVHFHNSLDTWSPTINVARDPRWGRNVESFGEDPFVCGVHGSAYTRGAQFGQWTNQMPDKPPSVYMTAVTLKHWFAYSLEYYPVAPYHSRHNFSANVSEFDLVGTYMEAWDRVVRDSDPKGVMCSYNLVNGRSTCGTPEITAMLRQSMGFNGYITSDTDVISDMYTTQNIVHTPQQAVTLGLEAGCDINSGGAYSKYLDSAISTGLLDPKFAKAALKRTYGIRFKLGLFDNKPNEFSNITADVVGQASFHQLSLAAARQGMVLLRNERAVLPLAKGKIVALIGQKILSTNVLLGNYVGPICVNGTSDCVPTLAAMVTAVNGPGSVIQVSDLKDTAALSAAVQQADQVVVFVDNMDDGGREGLDRVTIGPSPDQRSAAQLVLSLVGAKPCVLVLANGGHTSVDGWADGFPALLQAFMPGVHGAQAIAETIFGDNNPGGKLPVTMYKENFVNEVEFPDMSMTSGPGRTYRYYKGTPSFPFGFGLSYTTFSMLFATTNPPLSPTLSLDDIKHPAAVNAHPGLTRTILVMNTGDRSGDEVVFAYLVPHENVLAAMTQHRLREAPEDLHGSLKRDVLPKRKLIAFERVHVEAGVVESSTLNAPLREFALVNANGVKALYPGDYEIVYTNGNGAELTVQVTLVGEDPLVLSRLTKWW